MFSNYFNTLILKKLKYYFNIFLNKKYFKIHLKVTLLFSYTPTPVECHSSKVTFQNELKSTDKSPNAVWHSKIPGRLVP